MVRSESQVAESRLRIAVQITLYREWMGAISRGRNKVPGRDEGEWRGGSGCNCSWSTGASKFESRGLGSWSSGSGPSELIGRVGTTGDQGGVL